MRTVQSLTLGGMTPDGEDGVNELSMLCLEVCADVRQPYPNTSFRVNAETPPDVWQAITQTIESGCGQPMLLNDDTWIPNLEHLGYPVEDARDYFSQGCIEVMIPGKTPTWAPCGHVNFAQCIGMVLDNGGRHGDIEGLPTGQLESLLTFEDFLDATCRQVEHVAHSRVERASSGPPRSESAQCSPFASIFLDDCLEHGLDCRRGGTRHPPIRPVGGRGFGTAVDSLSAIRRFVYEEGTLTLAELRSILSVDFEGHETLRLRLQQAPPAFGNDDDTADEIARRLFDAYGNAVHAHNGPDVDARYVTSVFSYLTHVSEGYVTGATPNGRHARATLSDAMNPSHGCDRAGPTVLIRSFSKLDSRHITGGCAFNLHVTRSALAGDAGREALTGLLRTFITEGGSQIQVNAADRQTLRDAQKHPELHGNLIVRVAGYSEYFTRLDRKVQEEIIERAEHRLG